MRNLAAWDSILLDGLNRNVKIPGVIDVPHNFDWNQFLDVTPEPVQQRPRAKHVVAGLRNVTQEGRYVSQKRPKSGSDSEADKTAQEMRILKLAEDRRVNSKRTLTARGRERKLDSADRSSKGRRRRRRSSSSEDDRSPGRNRPPGGRGRGPPDGDPPDDDPPDDDDDDEDDEESEEDDDETTETSSEEDSTDVNDRSRSSREPRR